MSAPRVPSGRVVTRPVAARGARRALAVALAVVASLAGCGIPAEDHARPLPDGPAVSALQAPTTTASTTTTTAPEPVQTVDVFYVSGGRLVALPTEFVEPLTLSRVMAELAAGPPAAAAPALRSAIPAGVLRNVAVAGGIATVDLDPGFTELAGPEQILALAQIVYTATGLPGVGRVQFALGETPVQVPRADGSLVAGSVAREDYAPLLNGSAPAPAEPPAEAPGMVPAPLPESPPEG